MKAEFTALIEATFRTCPVFCCAAHRQVRKSFGSYYEKYGFVSISEGFFITIKETNVICQYVKDANEWFDLPLFAASFVSLSAL